jgi:transcriptional regulator with XRE-family HTH domain
MSPAEAGQPPVTRPGVIVRSARAARGLTLAQLGQRTGYSPSQVSRYERGVTPLTDIAVLRRFADALAIPPHAFGLAPAPGKRTRHGAPVAVTTARPHDPSSTVTDRTGREDSEEDPVRRRQLMASLAVTAAASAARLPGQRLTAQPDGGALVGVLISGVRDAMLGLIAGPDQVLAAELAAGLAGALADFERCRYNRLAVRLPRLISVGHLLAAEASTVQASTLLAGIYTLTTRMLIKLDDQQLGWMAADRAKILAAGGSDPLLEAETARNLAVLARKAGWHDQAAAIALAAAASPRLRGPDPRLAAERGLLIQSAAYTAARAHDRDGMRELTSQALALAESIGEHALLRDHGGFGPATVALHLISAENFAGDPSAAVATAIRLPPASLPTTERRARYWTDTARAYTQWGRRDEAISALLAGEYQAPQDIHARPAVHDLVRGLLITGRTGPDLRGLARRCGIS